MKKLLAGLATLVGVAACGEEAPYGSVVHFSSRDSTYDYFFTASARGPLLVDVHGEYPGYEDAGDAIRNAMVKGMPSRPFKATGDIAQAHSPAYRVIWLVAPPKSYNSGRVCKGQIPSSEPGEKATFAIIFCQDDKVLRDISGWVHPDVTMGSKNFSKFVGVVTRELFK